MAWNHAKKSAALAGTRVASAVTMFRLLGCVGFAALAVALGAACAPGTCSDAESHCTDAHTMETCSGSVDAVGQSRHSSTTTCPAATPYCVDTSNGRETSAACAVSNVKAVECAAAPNGEQCLGGRPSQCENGYLFSLASCDANHTCVVGPTSGYAICALSASPDPSCAAPAREYHCDGDAVLHCYDGFLLDKEICSGACDTETNECDVVADAGPDGS